MIPHVLLWYFFLRVIPLQAPSPLRFVGLGVVGAKPEDSKVSPSYYRQGCNKRNFTSHIGTFMMTLHVSLL
jgi:hypothetical protein